MKHLIKSFILLILIGCSSQDQAIKAIDLANELNKETRIIEIDDCTRFYKKVNGRRIYLSGDQIEREEIYYKQVLKEEGISEEKFNYYTNKLKETGLEHYIKKSNFSFFITGGAMGDINGIVVVHNSAQLPKEGIKLNDHYYVYFGKQIYKNVYYFSGG